MSKLMKTTPSVIRAKDRLRIAWPEGVALTFRLEHGCVLGIADVVCGEVPLRQPRRLWRPLISTPDGISYTAFRLRSVSVGRDGTVSVRTEALGAPLEIQEEQDEYLGDVLNLALPDRPVRDAFTWELKPASRTIDGRAFVGFSYRYHFTSRKGRCLTRLFDHATWEIGGRLAGNTLLLQGQVNPPVTTLTKATYFTTACNYYGAEMQGFMAPPKRVSFQRLPRMGTVQAFDCLVHPRGALLGLFEPLEEVFSVVQTHTGEDALHVVDEVRRPLAARFTTPAKHILFHAVDQTATWTREDQRNLWTAALDAVHTTVRRRHRVARSFVLPRLWIPQYDTETFTLDGKTYPRERMFQTLADQRIARWADMGGKEICTHSIWKSDYTEDRFVCKDHSRMHGALIVGSICNVRVHEVAPLWGGPKALAYFVKRAHRHGMQVQLWWSTHLSVRAPILQQRPDFMLVARDGLPNGGGFGHQSIATLDLNNPDCAAWLYQHLKTLHDQTGYDGLFHDSYGNMTFLPMNHADPLRRGQEAAYGRFVHRLQAGGIKTFTAEGIGPLGVGHFGMNLLPKDGKLDHGYQSALNWWLGEEDMVYGLNMGIGAPLWPGKNPDPIAFAFRCLAGGGRFGFCANDADHTPQWTGAWRDLNRLHGIVGPLNGRRTLLPDGQGVLWQQQGHRLLFAFTAFPFTVPGGARVERITPDGAQPESVHDRILLTHPGAVYRLGHRD